MEKFYFYNDSIKNKDIVVVSPHADDIAIGCGGAMAILSPTNAITPLLFFTGERGVDAADQEQRVKIREAEMCAEAEILGLQAPVFLRLLSYEHDNNSSCDIAQLETVLRDLAPAIVFLPNEHDTQPRHKLATELALAALKNSGFPGELFFYETSWGPFGPLDFNAGFELDAKIMAQKLKAIRVHRSQIKRTRFDIAAKSLAQFRAVVVPEQRVQGYGRSRRSSVKYLEVFLRTSLRHLM